MSKQVMCVARRDGDRNQHELIQSIGGIAGGYRWRDNEGIAIANVKRDPSSYYVDVRGKTVWVIVASHNGREYLKTQSDGYEPNNLLALPECW